MDFWPSTEQALLRSSLQDFLRDRYDFESRRRASQSEAGWRREIWTALAQELGLLGAALPERFGGAGGGAVEQMIVMEEFGAALVVEPYLETCVQAGGLLSRAGGALAEEALQAIVAGERCFALAWDEPGSRGDPSRISARAERHGDRWRLNGHKSVVTAAPWADQLLVTARGDDAAAGLSLFLVDVDAPGLHLQAYPTIDGRRAADIHFDGVELPADRLIGQEGAALPSVQQALDESVAAVAAEGLGVMRRLLDDTVEYTRQRRQFGQSIASFQAVQHRLVDMLLQREMAESASLLATLSLSAPERERGMAAAAAKVTVAQACRHIGQNAVQLHGGMGMTEELRLGSYFKRATAIETEFGSVGQQLARHARLERAA
ncbi:MAG TPA: acyl-CoA dehydrogenase [Solimonas sp.]